MCKLTLSRTKKMVRTEPIKSSKTSLEKGVSDVQKIPCLSNNLGNSSLLVVSFSKACLQRKNLLQETVNSFSQMVLYMLVKSERVLPMAKEKKLGNSQNLLCLTHKVLYKATKSSIPKYSVSHIKATGFLEKWKVLVN